MFWTMNDMPTAVIRRARRGALAQPSVGDELDRRVHESPERDDDHEASPPARRRSRACSSSLEPNR
jgi:hypothetical protein